MKERELFVCMCEDVQHQFVVSTFDDEPEIFVSVKLTRGNLWERLRNAFKYIFGKPCIYGDFDEVILDEVNIERLMNILYEKNNNNKKTEIL